VDKETVTCGIKAKRIEEKGDNYNFNVSVLLHSTKAVNTEND